jgi:hydantoinase/carbamoylase family amidase
MTADDQMQTRLAERLETIAGISAPGVGVTRPGFGELERDAHRQVSEWAAADGASVSGDSFGNTTLTYREGEPYFLLGSHLDSVPRGGRYDGVAGVVTALEAARVASDRIEAGLRVVAFSAEEGATFGSPCLGSSLATGLLGPSELDRLSDSSGATATDRAAQAGLSPRDGRPWLGADGVIAFLELHIEQGNVLESENVGIGIVDAVAGAARLRVRCLGSAGHSGTTPMGLRSDALAAAAELTLEVERIANLARGVVATVGKLDVEPNSVTTIPASVELMVDVRALDPGHQFEVVEEIEGAAARLAGRRGVEVETDRISWRDPVLLAAWPKGALKRACAELKVPFRVMSSGAGHDAAVVALKAPTAMLFVPTPRGMSHVPDEACQIEDLATGAEILARAICEMNLDLNLESQAGRGSDYQSV